MKARKLRFKLKKILMKKYMFRVSAIFFLILQVGLVSAQTQEEVRVQANKLAQTIYYLNSFYNDKVDNTKITDDAISKIVSELDPHSIYISAKDAKAMNEPLDGNFEGIGVEFAIINDTLTIANPISGGPSERVGILAGDKIVKIDGENIAGIKITNEIVFKKLRGNKGTKVNLTIKRKGVSSLLNFEVIRDKIPIYSLDACYEAEPGIVYLKLSRFSATSDKEIYDALAKLNLKTINGIILDLRSNGGGLLTTAFAIGDMFLDKGETIVYTEGKRFPKSETFASGNGFFKKGPLAVLIDENSASASEIIAGAIQDWDRGAIIGRRSFGNGLVQQMLPFSDGSQLRLTIARYHTPSGRVIQKPFVEGKRDEYYKDIIDRYKSGELFNSKDIQMPDSLKYKTLIKGRTVYGGGGITPDFFIPADTTDVSDYFMNLIRKGVINDFINDYSDKNRNQLKSTYKSFDSFNKNYKSTDKLLDELVQFAQIKGVAKDTKGIEISGERLKNYLKAMVARTIFDTSAYFRVINAYNDKEFKTALEYIKGNLTL